MSDLQQLTEKYKIGISNYKTIYSNLSTFGKIFYFIRISSSVIQVILGIVALIITPFGPVKDSFICLCIYVVSLGLVLCWFPLYFSVPQLHNNELQLVEEEDNRKRLQKYF